MSRSGPSSFDLYDEVNGRYNTIAPFIPAISQQESVASGTVDVRCYHTKLVTTDKTTQVTLPAGMMDGQLKKFLFAFQGTETAEMIVYCPQLSGVYERIRFVRPGDYAVLMWKGQWLVIETGNTLDPELYPIIE